MKQLWIMSLLLWSFSLSAQTFGEWFRQAKTQRKYLLEQIAAYQQYLTYLKIGYTVIQSGSNVITDSKAGDLQQHQRHIDSLSQVSPAIRNHPMVHSLLGLQAIIEPLVHTTRQEIETTTLLSTNEVRYISATLDGITKATRQSVQEKSNLLTDGKLQMTEAQRMYRLQELYADMQVRYGFLLSLRSQAILLQKFRYQEQSDIQIRKKVNHP